MEMLGLKFQPLLLPHPNLHRRKNHSDLSLPLPLFQYQYVLESAHANSKTTYKPTSCFSWNSNLDYSNYKLTIREDADETTANVTCYFKHFKSNLSDSSRKQDLEILPVQERKKTMGEVFIFYPLGYPAGMIAGFSCRGLKISWTSVPDHGNLKGILKYL